MSKIPQSRIAIERGISMEVAAKLHDMRPSNVFKRFANWSEDKMLSEIMQALDLVKPETEQGRREIFRIAHSVFDLK